MKKQWSVPRFLPVWFGACVLVLAAMFSMPANAAIAFRAAAQASVVTQVGVLPAYVAFQTGTTGAGGATFITMTRPGAAVVNRVLVAQITLKGVVATITAPAGWNLINQSSTSTAGAEITQAVYWRVETASEAASYTWSWTGTIRGTGGIFSFDNVETTNAVDVSGVRTTNNSATITLPNLTTTSSNVMLVALLGSSHVNTHTTPTGMTERFDLSTGAGPNGVASSGSTQSQANAGATGIKSATAANAADNIAHLVALRASGALTINVPIGTVLNDVMIASVVYRPCSNSSGGACTTTITPPAGWTLVRNTNTTTGGGTDGYGSRLFVYQRVATATEPASYTWYFGGALPQAGAAGGILSFSGVDTASPVVAEAGQATGSSSNHEAPSIDTGAVTNTMLVSSHSLNSSGTWTAPGGMTEAVDVSSRTPNNDLGVSLEINYQAQAAAGATGIRTATLSNPPAVDTGGTHMLALRPASGGLHHLEIQHGSGTGVTCTPSTLTIKACADALNPCTPYTAGVSGTLSATTGAPTVNWGGGSGAFTIASGDSTVTKSVQVTTVGSTVFGATSTPIATSASTCNFGSPSCTFTAADSGFIVSAPNHAAETSSTLTIQAVKKADNSLACVPGMTGAKSVNLKCSYVNPSSGTLPVRVGGTALNSTSNAAVACDSNGQNVSLTFDATGVATPTLQYADVGNILINASFTGAAGTIDAGLSMLGSGSFIAAPASFAFSSITSGLIKAGNSFGATVTARNSSDAATPNFGKESSPEGVTLSSNLVSMPGANNPAITNNNILGGAFSNGVATVSNLSWGEVGLITLTANLTSGDYLSSALSATGTSENVGRFIPDHFDTAVSGGMACPSGLTCPTLFNGFVYSGQPFTTSVTARNLGGTTTTNYSNSLGYSKDVTLTAWDALGSSTIMPVTPAGNAVAASAFTAGVATVTPSYTFVASPTTPTNIYIRAVDTDSVTSLRSVPADSIEGGIKIVSGLVSVSSAYGSELLRLPVGVVVQYWNGTRWVTSSTDATALAVGNVGLANCQKNLGDPAPACKPAVVVGSVTLANGVGSIVLNVPGSGNNGSVDLTLNAAGWPAWLPSTTGRAAFGVYKSRFIYLREMY